MLVEANDTHGVVIAGYLKYFQDMEYNIDILVNPAAVSERPFCRLDLSDVSVFTSDFPLLSLFFASSKFREYRHIVLMTSAAYFHETNGMYTSALAYYPQLRKHPSLFVVEHDLNDVERFNEQSLMSSRHLITLGHFPRTVFVSPILFGNVRLTQGNGATFICVGGIQKDRKNHRKLLAAMEELVLSGLNFKVIVIGRGELEDLPERIRPYVEITGRIDFPRMFEQMGKARFYLPLLDPNNPAHDRYITSGVTGSAQLIYAFGKVPVIHPHFASFYGFDAANAIIAADLAEGMRTAITLNPQEYESKQAALVKLSDKLRKESIDNLKEIFS